MRQWWRLELWAGGEETLSSQCRHQSALLRTTQLSTSTNAKLATVNSPKHLHPQHNCFTVPPPPRSIFLSLFINVRVFVVQSISALMFSLFSIYTDLCLLYVRERRFEDGKHKLWIAYLNIHIIWLLFLLFHVFCFIQEWRLNSIIRKYILDSKNKGDLR